MGAPESETPAVQQQNEWANGFWDCCSPAGTCFWGCCLPCCLFGKTQSRLDDPQLKEYSYMNGNVLLSLLPHSPSSFHWVLLMIRRGEIRQRFGIEGSGVGDCCSSYWCPCCVIMQHEKEIEAQSERPQTGYQAPTGMAYAPQ
ncbi:DUF614 domain protein [Aspergillus bombycis]|uniref:DUF614 domain protein n=1 Tax=Aspergillus bombycis TaxID=109264 RepID=A0A1F8A9R0_9EURO|nr:DUF614 domain protein [Aspergillus bombycis]OGM48482.1 DUF614 domain protein [Aspergillus bombycis]